MSGHRGQQPPKANRPDSNPPARIDVRDVMRNSREVILVHNGQDYRLRVTSNDRLILTK